eukprot:scaffold164470_cov14-Tisochrysis_lutea.AAC.1
MSSQADRWKQAGDLLAISVLWSCTLEARMPGTDDAGTLDSMQPWRLQSLVLFGSTGQGCLCA